MKAVLLGAVLGRALDWADSTGEALSGAGSTRADECRTPGPTIVALAAAGCPLVEIAEPDALAIAGDRSRGRIRAAHAVSSTAAKGCTAR